MQNSLKRKPVDCGRTRPPDKLSARIPLDTGRFARIFGVEFVDPKKVKAEVLQNNVIKYYIDLTIALGMAGMTLYSVRTPYYYTAVAVLAAAVFFFLPAAAARAGESSSSSSSAPSPGRACCALIFGTGTDQHRYGRVHAKTLADHHCNNNNNNI